MIVTIDGETTTHNKGNPFDVRNKLVSIHANYDDKNWSYRPTIDRETIQNLVDKATLLVLFNGKFDLHWLRKTGIDFTGKAVYDVQLAFFYLSRQKHRFPSLDEVLTAYNIPLKESDEVHKYWDQGIQTDEIPWDKLCVYGEGDVQKTYLAYLHQMSLWKEFPKMYKLFRVACADLLVLQEMEWNGLKYDSELCQKKSEELQVKINELTSKLVTVYPDIPINFNSPDQLSAFLFGGYINEETKEHIGFYKTGLKQGQPKFKNVIKQHHLPRLFTPIKAMAKEGVFSTDEGSLRKLKGKHKWIVEVLLELAKVTKLDETYYQGMIKINQEMHWPKGMLYGQFNQCVTGTGRLSSSKPNLQNLSGQALEIFVSRYSS